MESPASFSEAEFTAFIFLLLGAGMVFVVWRLKLRNTTALAVKPRERLPLVLGPALGFVWMLGALWKWGAWEMRANPGYILLVGLLGISWLAATTMLFPWLGISFRDDALERCNPAAILAVSGAQLGTILAFTGANLGEGESLLENVFTAIVATAEMLAVWMLLEVLTRISLKITEERDVAAGKRLGIFLTLTGAIIGCAAAGDWISEVVTLEDMAKESWPLIPLLAIAVIAEKQFFRPSRSCQNCSTL